MNGSDKNGEGKKVNEIKTFPVPFSLDEIKTDISINTNSPSKPSKEQIINQAIQFHLKGNIPEASKCYQYCINQGFNDHRIFSNYGVILIDLGKLKEAELSTRKAIELKHDYADAHCNLGTILRDLGKSQDAFDSYLKVMEINSTHSNLYTLFTILLRDSDPSKLNQSQLNKILNILLDKNDLPHQELFKVFNFLYRNEIISNLEKLDSDFPEIELLINDKVIINAFKKIIFKDPKLEKILTKVRKSICHRIATNIETINYSELQFIIALGEQCFLNEYIYSLTKEENISIDIIINKCRNGDVNEINISILSCYFPLYKLLDQIPSLKSFNSSNQSLKELIELQITEPIKEIKLSQNIKKLGSINDDVSQKVKSQYEENPYPRWRYGNLSKKVKFNQAINNDIKPNSINNIIGNGQLKVLVAGCGTGRHILDTQKYKNAQITAIDLSLSSLSYAQRKINELGINNVELIQMDILEIDLLEERFDIIESSGVLHHMNDPIKGLQALLGVLNNNGFLRLGLYSELARQGVIKTREFITKHNIEATEENIRKFRQYVLSENIQEVNTIKSFGDFYTTSTFRDLCFHTQEHRFSINQLQETLKSNELEFLGFLLPKPVKSLYKKYFPEDKKQTNLQNWSKFEEKHPNTFRGMYQFWVSKTEN